MKTTKAFSRNKFTSALLILTIGLNGCAMIQPAAMSGPCRDPATGRYTSCSTGSTGPSSWDRLSSDDRLAVGLTIGVALAGLAAWGIYEMVSASDAVSRARRPQEQCVLTAQQFSEHWNCETLRIFANTRTLLPPLRLFGQGISPSVPMSVGQTVPTTAALPLLLLPTRP